MNICHNCGSSLPLGERYCPSCGAAAHSTKTRSVTLDLSRKDARRGCVRLLRYPGAPAPIRIRLPKKLYDGAELYLNDLPFVTGDGGESRGALRIVIRVAKRRLLPALTVSALLVAAIVGLVWLDIPSLPIVGQVMELIAPEESAPPTLSPSPVVQTPEPTPEPTPDPLAHLSPMQREALTVIPHFELRYFLMNLDDRLLENFCALYIAVRDFHPSCSFPQPLNRDELANLMLLISYECPELLQFSAATEMKYFMDDSGQVLSVDLVLSLSQEQYARQYEVCAAAAEQLAKETAGLSQQEKELFAYQYLTDTCYYDFDALWAESAYGALGEGRAKCDGISLAMKWLCEEMGISCMVVAGAEPDQEIGHAWNVICIDGTYYDLDVTNDVRSDESRVRYYGAFNVSRYWIRNQYTENFSFSGFLITPGSESMDMSFHALCGTYVSAGADYEAQLYRRLSEVEDGQPVYLQFESVDQYHQFINDIDDIMSRWDGLSRGSFNFSMSHLDEFRVCCLTVSFI